MCGVELTQAETRNGARGLSTRRVQGQWFLSCRHATCFALEPDHYHLEPIIVSSFGHCFGETPGAHYVQCKKGGKPRLVRTPIDWTQQEVREAVFSNDKAHCLVEQGALLYKSFLIVLTGMNRMMIHFILPLDANEVDTAVMQLPPRLLLGFKQKAFRYKSDTAISIK